LWNYTDVINGRYNNEISSINSFEKERKVMKKNKRFDVAFNETMGLGSTTSIIVDTETGVNYLLVTSGYGAGLTPLLDENGKIVVKNPE
jgi:hypothetical protein